MSEDDSILMKSVDIDVTFNAWEWSQLCGLLEAVGDYMGEKTGSGKLALEMASRIRYQAENAFVYAKNPFDHPRDLLDS